MLAMSHVFLPNRVQVIPEVVELCLEHSHLLASEKLAVSEIRLVQMELR